MTAAARTFTQGMIARLSAAASVHACEGRTFLADILHVQVGELQARVAAMPVPAIEVARPAGEDAGENGCDTHSTDPAGPITWRSPVFHGGGSFNPFAGSKRDRLLASAATCRRLGAAEAAAMYERLAAAEDRDPLPAHSNEPPPEPVPFAAGPQLDLFG